MREIDAASAATYLRETCRVAPDTTIAVRELSGGVSNIVLRVDVAGEPPYVLKQSRERLRVAMEWYSPLERIWTERAALDVLAEILPEGCVPRIRFEDRDEFLFAMDCAPDDAVTWKSRLMAGDVDLAIGRRIGTLLGTIHAEAASHPAIAVPPLCETALFDSLRVDPYYRTTTRAHPDLADRFASLIDSMTESSDATLVLGDFSPKNILVHERGVVLLDFECAHRGDPAFDLGFVFSHFLLKTFRAERQFGDNSRYRDLIRDFWDGYTTRAGIDPDGDRARRSGRHAAACLLARLDGKSPVEYRHEFDVELVRRFARDALASDRPFRPWEGFPR